MSDDSDNKEISLKSNKGPDVIFNGTLLASVTNKGIPGSRWVEIDCYRTSKRTLIAQKRGCSDLEGEVTKYAVVVATTNEDLVKELGYGDLEKILYEKCGIAHQKRIE